MQRTSVGIDIGVHSVKVVQLKVTEKGAFIQNALYFDRASLASRGVELEDRVAVAALLKGQMSELHMPTRGVVLSISGSDSIIRYTSIPPVPSWRLKVIMGYEVTEVEERVGEKLANDFVTLPVPRESEDDDQVVLVGLAKEEQLEAILADLESAGIYVARAIPAPLALYSAYEAFGDKCDLESEEDELVVVVDIGRSNLHSVLLLNDNLVFARSVGFGGENFTEALARDLGVDAQRAEQIKIKRGTVDLGAAQGKQEEIVGALRGGAAQIQSLVQSSLRFCRSQTGTKLPAPKRIVLLGGGARLGGLPSYLQKAFQAPVELFHPHGVSATGGLGGQAAEVFASHPGDFAVSLGLAVAGVRDSGLTLNVIPERYRERRRFRERTLYLYAAGVMLLLTLIVGAINGWIEHSRANAHATELRQLNSRFERQRVEMEENRIANAEVRQRINRVIREVEVTAFQAFLLDFLSASLPAEVRVTRLRFTATPDADDVDLIYVMELEGIADNSDRLGNDRISQLIQDLEADVRVADVDLDVSRPEGTLYRFKMFISPAFQGYQA